MKPIKRLGQNFLIDKRAVKKLIAAADLNPKDIVLEIGPGLGALTQELVKENKVIAVEKDFRLCQLLKDKFKNLEIINQDILNYILPVKKYKIVSSLPFYISTAIIRKFLEINNPPQIMALIVQKEVGQRICAKPPDMNALAVFVQIYAKVEIISYISKESFSPKPKVDSAIIKIVPEKKHEIEDDFFKIVKVGFSHPRKKLINNLSQAFKKEDLKDIFTKLNINLDIRAERLSIDDWIELSKMV